MLPKRLSVRALGPIEHADLTGDYPVTLLLGPNETGKTTLLEALQVLYFGTRGSVPVKENSVLTRAGAKGWTVELEVGDKVLRATRSQRLGHRSFGPRPAEQLRRGDTGGARSSSTDRSRTAIILTSFATWSCRNGPPN